MELSENRKLQEVFEKFPEKLKNHVKAVAKFAEKLAEEVEADTEVVKKGALLHDAGRLETHGLRHCVEGAKLLEEKGFCEEIVEIARNHVGAGLSRKEAAKAGLPKADYMPKTLEEKIVAYADSRHEGKRLLTFEESLEKFKKELGDKHPAIKRFKELHNEINSNKRENN